MCEQLAQSRHVIVSRPEVKHYSTSLHSRNVTMNNTITAACSRSEAAPDRLVLLMFRKRQSLTLVLGPLPLTRTSRAKLESSVLVLALRIKSLSTSLQVISNVVVA